MSHRFESARAVAACEKLRHTFAGSSEPAVCTYAPGGTYTKAGFLGTQQEGMTPGRAWTVTEHCEAYEKHVKIQQGLLLKVCDDLEVSLDEQNQLLVETGLRAQGVWTEALASAERQRGSLRESIDEFNRRIVKIQTELSDESFGETVSAEQSWSAGNSFYTCSKPSPKVAFSLCPFTPSVGQRLAALA